MGKHSRCVTDISDNDMQHPEWCKKRSNTDGNLMMHKLPKDRAVKSA